MDLVAVETLMEAEWRPRVAAHQARVDGWVEPHLRRRSQGIAHPVEDFLFTFYSHSPGALRRWHPGLGLRLLGEGVQEFRGWSGYVVEAGVAAADRRLSDRRTQQLRTMRRLLGATAQRPMTLSCFGLHEWAMVHGQRGGELRHATYPLRLGPTGTDDVVESHRLTCTHYDAFRFFAPPARPRNALQPTRETQQQHEQPGCLHATMDLYKWAYQLSPLSPAELVADCFALAREVRLVDMRAAPYDLSGIGVEPIAIETAAGKQAYVEAQRGFADRAAPLRSRLISLCDQALAG